MVVHKGRINSAFGRISWMMAALPSALPI